MSKWPEDLTRKRSNSNIKSNQTVSNKILLNIHKYKLYPAPEGVFVNKPNLNKQLNFTTLEETMTKDKISLIGDGSFSKVFLYQDKKTKIKYAVKKMLIELVLNKTNNKNIIDSEISIQSKIIHPNIIRLYNFFLDKEKQNYYLILEYASHGTLFEKIRFKKGFEESNAFYYFIQAVNAVFFLHNNHIIHRDIKPENLLINENNILKLCDFGWSVYLLNEKRVTFCGTVEYMAPEILKSKGYGFSIDIWSLGILLYELIHAFSPFAGNNLNFNNTIEKNIMSKEITFKKEISDECKDLIMKLLMKDANKRIKLKDVYQHPFILRYVNLIYHQLKIPIKNTNSNNKSDSNDRRITPLNSNRNKKIKNNPLNKSKITEISNESSQESSIISTDNIPKEPQVKKLPINSINSKINKDKDKEKEKEKEKEKNKNNNIRNRNIRQSNKIIRTNKTYVNTNSIMEANHKKTFSLNNLLANDIIKDEAKKGKYHKVGTHENHGKPKVKLNKYNLEKLLSKDGPDDKLTINIKKTSSKKNNQNRISKIFNSASNKNLSISKQQSMTSQHLKSKNSKNEIKKKLIYNYTTSNLMQKPKMNNHHIHINKRNHNINGSHLTNSRSITFLNSNNNKNNQALGALGTYIIYSNPSTKKKNNLKNKFTNQRNHVINLNNHYNLSYTDLSNRNYKYRHPKKIALNLSNLNETNSFENEENSNSFKAKKFIQKVNTMLDKDQLKNSIPHRVSYSTKNYSTDRRSPKKSLHLNKINSPAMTNSETRKKHVLKYMRSNHNHNLFVHYSGLKNTEENEKNGTDIMDSYRNRNSKHNYIPQVNLDLKKNK